MLYGQNPNTTRVPVYAHVTDCGRKKFHVSYWLFFPFSQGKPICTLDMGVLGPLPLPVINNRCFGTLKEFGSHVGDWEHMSLMFDVSMTACCESHANVQFMSRVYSEPARTFLENNDLHRIRVLRTPNGSCSCFAF